MGSFPETCNDPIFWGLKQLLLSVPLPFIYNNYIGFTLFALMIVLMITDYTEIL